MNQKITNQTLADTLEKFADDLEFSHDNPYRIRAYRRAAIALRRLPKEITDMVKQGEDLTSIPHVGEKIAMSLQHMIINNHLELVITKKPIKFLNKKVNRVGKERLYKIYLLMPVIEKMIQLLSALKEVKRIEAVGDYRRRRELVSNITLLIQSTDIKKVFAEFQQLPPVKYIISEEDNTTTVQLKVGIYLSLLQVEKEDFAAKLLEYTGTKEHYEALQTMALKPKGCLTGKSEEEIYSNLKLSFIPPELRENRGEIEAASKHALPQLIELTDIKGDLHCHTNETDGLYTLEEMVEAAKLKGYQYVAITDHSQSLKITNGMDEKRLLKQIEKINQLNEKLKNIVILKSMEIDILEDGRLDLSDEVLKELDLTVCSIHSKFKLDCDKQTTRILRAMDNPYFTILGHATGRLLQHRPPYLIDVERVLLGAKERNCMIEVNAQPARLDINDLYCKQAKEIGVKVAISSDAHTTKGFNFMILGVNQARRGWLSASDVINTYDLVNLKKLIKR